MNILYAKAVLYAYPHVDKIAEQIDELVEKKAYNSFSDFSPAYFQMEKIVELTNQKVILFNLRDDLEKILSKFSEDELDLLDYKYFKKKPKSYYENFDFSSRSYFRKQIRIVEKVAEKLEKAGLNDKWFIKDCLSMDFFKELIKRVKERESIANKNKVKPKNSTVKPNTENINAKAS